MDDDNNIKNFSAADIEKYHKGLLSSKERHALEKAALDDPFLADALEGYGFAGATASNDIADLQSRLKERTGSKIVAMRPRIALWKVAAMIILIGGAGFFVYQFAFNNEKQNVATLETKDKDHAVNPPVTTIQSEQPIKVEERAKDQTTNKETITITSGLAGKNSEGVNNLSDTLSITDFKKSNPSLSVSAPTKQIEEKETFNVAKTETKKPATDDNRALDGFVTTDKMYKRQGISADQEKGLAKRKDETYRNNYFRGRVMDSTNNALPFANITNTTDNVGTYADAKGYFTLISPDTVLNVQVRSVGFENNNIALRSDVPTNKIVLQEDRSLSEIVLNNYRPNESRLQELREANIKIEEPEPVDGWGNYDTYLVNNLKAPDEQRSKQLNGQVEVSFEVNKNGEPVNIKVERSLCKTCDEEAIRLVKEGPKWKRRGKSRARVSVPFSE